MKNAVKFLSLILALFMCLSFAACGKNNTTSSTPSGSTAPAVKAKMAVAYMTGPTGIGMAKLVHDDSAGATAIDYDFTVADSAADFKVKFLKKEINIASVPTNLAASLYKASNGSVRILAVNTNGVLSIIQNGGTAIDSIEDLRGKTLYSAGGGSNPEYILKYILEQNGLTVGKDIEVIFAEASDINAKLIKGEAEFAMLPEPAASTVMTKSDKLQKVLSINEEWNKVSDTELMMGCVVAHADYIEANKATVEKFLEEYKASIEFAKTNVDTAATYCTEAGVTVSDAIAKKVIPDSNLCFVTGKDMKNNLIGYYNVLFAANPQSIGGALPADEFYYNAK